MTSQNIRQILKEAKEVGTVKWVFFEGGKPFLYYPVLAEGVRWAAHLGVSSRNSLELLLGDEFGGCYGISQTLRRIDSRFLS